MRSLQESVLFPKLFPEINLLEDEDRRHQVFVSAMRKCKPTDSVAVVMFLLTTGFLIYSYRAAWDEHRFLYLSLLVIVFAFGSSITALFIHAKAIRITLRSNLNRFGIPICVACGYRLEGATSGRCPECGESRSTEEIRDPSDTPR